MSPRTVALVLALGFGQMVAFASSFYLLGVLGDPMARDLKTSPQIMFSLMSLALLVSALAGPRVGRWLDDSGGKVVLLISSGLFAAALTIMACAASIWVLGCGMALMGAAMALGLYGTPFRILVGVLGEGARPGITGVALLGGLGGALGWPVTLMLETAFGWRGACLVWAAAHLLVCLPLAAWVVPKTQGSAPETGTPAAPMAWDRRMVQLAVLFAGAWWLSAAMGAHLPRVLEAFGLPRGAAVSMAALAGTVSVAVRGLELLVLRRLPPLVTARMAALMHPIGAGLLLTLGRGCAAALPLGQGAGGGLLSVASGTLPLTVFGPERYGQRSALLQTPARLLQVTGPTAFALLLAWSPREALVATSVISLIMVLSTFGLTRRDSRIT